MRATVITDASWCHDTRAGGWAAWIALDGGEKLKVGGEFTSRPPTSTEAELRAVCNGIHHALMKGCTFIFVQTDCEGIIQRIRDKNLPMNLPRNLTLYAKHVKGHSKRPEPRFYCNRWCDQQARYHMRQVRKRVLDKRKRIMENRA